jgi:hypothetical protein
MSASTKGSAPARPEPKLSEAQPPAPAAPAEPAAAAAAPQAPAKPSSLSPLLSSSWKARESGVYLSTHEVIPEAGTPIEHLVRPDFWANVAQRFKMGDTIVAMPRDGAWYAEFVVWDAGQNWARVQAKFDPMTRPSLGPAPGVLDDFDVRRDPIEGYCAIRKSTGAKLKGGFPNAEAARQWFLDHQRALRH